MVRGTTPTYILKLPKEIDLSIADDVYVTFSNQQFQILLTKSGSDLEIEENKVSVFLTQEETLSMPRGEVYVQVNWLYLDGATRKRACTKIKEVPVKRNLIDEVL